MLAAALTFWAVCRGLAGIPNPGAKALPKYSFTRRLGSVNGALMRLTSGAVAGQNGSRHAPVAGGSDRKGTGEGKAVMSISGH